MRHSAPCWFFLLVLSNAFPSVNTLKNLRVNSGRAVPNHRPRRGIQIFACSPDRCCFQGSRRQHDILRRKEEVSMKRIFWFAILSVLLVAPGWLAAQETHGDYDHGSVGIFADYFRFAPTSNSHTNFVGFGARAGFNASRYVAIEGEMNYDFERNFTNTTSNGARTSFTTTR